MPIHTPQSRGMLTSGPGRSTKKHGHVDGASAHSAIDLACGCGPVDGRRELVVSDVDVLSDFVEAAGA